MESMPTSAPRVYAGVDGDQRVAERRARLMEAGLDLLGAEDGPATVTVRGVCKHAGLVARYFYESFADRDALITTVYDAVIDDIATSTLAAVTAAAPDERAKVRAGIANIVRTIAADPRRGRLLFSPGLASTLLAHRRMESTRLFASLLGEQVRDFYQIADSQDLDVTAHFLTGGLAQALIAWLNGSITASERRLVEHCTELFVGVARHPGIAD